MDNNNVEDSIEKFVAQLSNFLSTNNNETVTEINDNINEINEDVNVIKKIRVTRIGDEGEIEKMEIEIKNEIENNSSEINEDIIELSNKLSNSQNFTTALSKMQNIIQENGTIDNYLEKQLELLSNNPSEEIISNNFYCKCLVEAIILSLLKKCDNILMIYPENERITNCKEILTNLNKQVGGSNESESLSGGAWMNDIRSFIITSIAYILGGVGMVIFCVYFVLLVSKAVLAKGIIGIFVGIALIVTGLSLNELKKMITEKVAIKQAPVYRTAKEYRIADKIEDDATWTGYSRQDNIGGKKQKRNTRRKRNFRQNKKNTERKNRYYKLTRKRSKRSKRYKRSK